MKRIVLAALVMLTPVSLARAETLYPVPQAQEIQFQTTPTDKMSERYAERAATAQYIETRLDAALQGEPYLVDCNDNGCTISWQEAKK